MTNQTDLQLARASSSIDSPHLSTILHTPQELELRSKIVPILAADPLFSKVACSFNSHAQNLHLSLRLCKRLLELRDQHNWTHDELKAAISLTNEPLPLGLHESAFASVIEAQGTDEQCAKWIPRCRSYKVIGCYCQTELAHGSNVQGLETLARYNPATREFVVFSPRRESTKWWIGGLGVLSNHAMVQAILQLPDGKGKWISKGPHLFIVPIRDAVTHQPLPGVTVGDIGPKSYGGFGFMDNGYLHLDSVHIPLEHMLQRFAKLSPSGEYTPGKFSKLSYGSMVALRAWMPANVGWQLARAVTIAVRYCVTRRQFPDGSDQERRVIEYASTKYRLYPLIARAYAYILAGRRFADFYRRMLQDLTTTGDVTLLPEVHALSTALKVQSTWQCVAGVEEARKAMGGHGYSHMSGVGSIFASQTPTQTFEGDNYVISQQIARALLRALQLLKANPDALLPESFAYLKQATSAGNGGKVDWNNRSHQLALLHKRAAHILNSLAATLSDKPWSEHTWTCSRLAAAHADVYVVASLPEELPLGNLHALTTLMTALPELVEAGTVGNPAALRMAHEAAVDEISVGDAVRLTDAFDFDDWELPGVVGGEEGGFYEKMLESAVKHDVSRGEIGEELRQLAKSVVGHSGGAVSKL